MGRGQALCYFALGLDEERKGLFALKQWSGWGYFEGWGLGGGPAKLWYSLPSCSGSISGCNHTLQGQMCGNEWERLESSILPAWFG